jgi:hypothetical protein
MLAAFPTAPPQRLEGPNTVVRTPHCCSLQQRRAAAHSAGAASESRPRARHRFGRRRAAPEVIIPPYLLQDPLILW